MSSAKTKGKKVPDFNNFRPKAVFTGILFLLLSVLLAGSLPAKPAKIKAYSDVSPRTCMSLKEMSSRYGFSSFGVKGKQITMQTRFNTFSMKGDSRRAEFNKIAVWLSAPIARQWGSWHIRQVDIDRTIWPLLNPDKALASEEYQIVVLDPGHGGSDRGAQSRGGLDEKTLTLELARNVRRILLQYRIDARLTRNSDRPLQLDERVAIANRWKSSLFISIHLNAAGSSIPAGIETYILPPAGYPSTSGGKTDICDPGVYAGNKHDRANMVLGYLIQKSMLKYAGGEDRGVRRARFVVLKNIACPAALLECGFLSNRSEAAKFEKAGHRDKVSRGIAEGIIAYLNAVKRARQIKP